MKKYNTIVVDPPWPYKGLGPVGDGQGTTRKPTKSIVQVAARSHYSLLTLKDLTLLNVQNLSSDNCHLYLWVTNQFIVQGFLLAKAWKFKPKAFLTWGKVKKTDRTQPSMKTGYYFRGATEHCIFAVKGKMPLKTQNGVATLLLDTRLPHSQKPQSFFDTVEVCSNPPYVELFARKKRKGWDVWGKEVISNPNVANLLKGDLQCSFT